MKHQRGGFVKCIPRRTQNPIFGFDGNARKCYEKHETPIRLWDKELDGNLSKGDPMLLWKA